MPEACPSLCPGYNYVNAGCWRRILSVTSFELGDQHEKKYRLINLERKTPAHFRRPRYFKNAPNFQNRIPEELAGNFKILIARVKNSYEKTKLLWQFLIPEFNLVILCHEITFKMS